MATEGFDRGVIVADDSALMRDNVRSALGEPWRVFVAANGIEAVQYARVMRAALVLLDVRMPRMDGLDACAQIRVLPHYATTPIVMLTAYDDEDMRRRAKLAGATALFRKPFTIGRLRADLLPLLGGGLSAALRDRADPSRVTRQPDRPSLPADDLTRNSVVMEVCRDVEAAIAPRGYANVAEALAALRALSRR
jgi:two-component system chemotaxis response regulator CheY